MSLNYPKAIQAKACPRKRKIRSPPVKMKQDWICQRWHRYSTTWNEYDSKLWAQFFFGRCTSINIHQYSIAILGFTRAAFGYIQAGGCLLCGRPSPRRCRGPCVAPRWQPPSGRRPRPRRPLPRTATAPPVPGSSSVPAARRHHPGAPGAPQHGHHCHRRRGFPSMKPQLGCGHSHHPWLYIRNHSGDAQMREKLGMEWHE